jgi:hypothetical protein
MRAGAMSLACVLFIGIAPPATAAAVFTVYMSATGSDTASGLTLATAVKTLVRVQEILRTQRPVADVEVRIKQGTYVAPPMQNWRFYVPGRTISFLPVDYEYGEDETGIAGRPIFRNRTDKPEGFWLQPRLPRETSDPLYNGGTSGLRFFYLQIEEYSSGGVSVWGDSERDVTDDSFDPPLRKPGSTGLNGNTFQGVRFYHLGNMWAPCPGCDGYGAIVLTNSSDNDISGNEFVNIENDVEPGMIHGTYVTHFSSRNTIAHNTFSGISGDPVKLRDRSNHNNIEFNTFTRSGVNSFYREEFCDLGCIWGHSEVNGRQCASYHNRFADNQLRSDYDGDNSSESWTLSPAGLTHPGEYPCSIPAGDQRLRTARNTTG